MLENRVLPIIVVVVLLLGCKKFEPAEEANVKYPGIDKLLTRQLTEITSKKLQKQVWLGDESEIQLFDVDSSMLTRELDFLGEINPNAPEYVGAFNEDVSLVHLALTLNEGENGSLKYFRSSKSANQTQSIEATIHEDKDIFTHHREIKINLFKDVITDYEITGYQRIVRRDTIRFSISGKFQN